MALARCRFAVLVNCSAHPSRIFSDELSSRDQRGFIPRPVSCAPTSIASLSSDDPISDLTHLQLVLARSMSVEQAARRYRRRVRAIRDWASVAPISVRIAGGSHRVSVPLADIYSRPGPKRTRGTGCRVISELGPVP